jgi:hypothetical protein
MGNGPPLPPQRTLNRKQNLHQLLWRQLGFRFDHAVKKPPATSYVYWLRFIKRRLPRHPEALRIQRRDRLRYISRTISHVRSQ